MSATQSFLATRTDCSFTQGLIDRLKVETQAPWLTESYIRKRGRELMREERDDAYEPTMETRFLWIEFKGGKITTDHGRDVRSNFFEGITLPVEHAKILAQRIAGFITEIENAK